MYDNWKNTKRGSITEERISTLLPRYSIKTVLQLLQEVAISATETIDWNAIVKSTTNEIFSARQYQMVWRHLAYGQTLTDQFDDTNPLDDDSDLEYEVEAYPVVSRRSSAEASACVKRWASICLEKGNFGTRDSAEHFEVCKAVARAMNAARIYNSNLSKPEVDNCTSASGNTLGGNTQGNQASISLSRPVNQTQDLQVALTRPEVDENGKKHGDTITTGKEIHDEN